MERVRHFPQVARALLPAEWIVLAFGAFASIYLCLHGGLAALAAFPAIMEVRGKRILVALLIVGTVHLGRAFFALRSPLPPRARRGLSIALVPCVLPVLLGAWAYAGAAHWQHWSSTRPDDQVHLLSMAVLRVLGVGAPTLAAWFFVARYAKEHQRLEVWPLAVEGTRGLLQAAREWMPLVILIPCYSWMAEVIGQPAVDRDGWMQAADGFLFLGADPVAALQAIIWAPLSEWLAFSYSFYAVFYSLSLGAVFMLGGRLALREGITAMCLGLAVTYVSYALVPVKGPALSQGFDVSLELYFIKEVKEMLMDHSRITYDCFPSFHTAGTLIMSWLCYRHARKVFWWTLPMVLSTPLACVYLRYHYVIDVLAGFALFVAVARVTPWLLRRWSALQADPGNRDA